MPLTLWASHMKASGLVMATAWSTTNATACGSSSTTTGILASTASLRWRPTTTTTCGASGKTGSAWPMAETASVRGQAPTSKSRPTTCSLATPTPINGERSGSKWTTGLKSLPTTRQETGCSFKARVLSPWNPAITTTSRWGWFGQGPQEEIPSKASSCCALRMTRPKRCLTTALKSCQDRMLRM